MEVVGTALVELCEIPICRDGCPHQNYDRDKLRLYKMSYYKNAIKGEKL